MPLLDIVAEDFNIVAAGLLLDMATLQSSERSRFGYARAARMIASGIDRSVRDLVHEGTLRAVPTIGPASERIISELVQTGGSGTVERAIHASNRRTEVEKRRGFRRAFLSRHVMRAVLEWRQARSMIGTGTYRGDLQMHSTWSDGVEPIASLAGAAHALGWSRIGVTDHSYGLPIAGGMTMEAAARQHEEIDAVNAEFRGRVRVYKGVEANILPDGSLDLGEHERRRFEYVVASPHSLLRKDADQTARMMNAVKLPGVAILGHPQGRMYNTRAGVKARWRSIFEEAARRGVAIEIDGNWHRQDVDYELAARALDAGCLFALDSDAHSLGELPFTDYAIAHARIAAIPADRVVNAWDAATFESWLIERHGQSNVRVPPKR